MYLTSRKLFLSTVSSQQNGNTWSKKIDLFVDEIPSYEIEPQIEVIGIWLIDWHLIGRYLLKMKISHDMDDYD